LCTKAYHVDPAKANREHQGTWEVAKLRAAKILRGTDARMPSIATFMQGGAKSGKAVALYRYGVHTFGRFGSHGVQLMRNPYQAIERVEGVEGIEKCERIVYSVDSGISLRRTEFLRSQSSSPSSARELLVLQRHREPLPHVATGLPGRVALMHQATRIARRTRFIAALPTS
jgi:hypothetical protein